jgi:4-alpha-glucanotransferase
MKFDRASGILLHPTSLPGPYGIGDFGQAAFRWVDWLAGTGCKLWQVLPMGPTGYGNSPYQSFSAFAGNPYLISPEFLIRENLLYPEDFTNQPEFDPSRVDFGSLIPWKLALLKRSFSHFSNLDGRVRNEYDIFCSENASWLDD